MIVKYARIIDTNLTTEEMEILSKASEIFLRVYNELNAPLTLTNCSGTLGTRAEVTTEELFKIGDFLDTFGRYHHWHWDKSA